MMLRGRWVDL